MLRIWEDAGFDTEVSGVDRWKEPGIRRSALAREFTELSEDELRIPAFAVVLRSKP